MIILIYSLIALLGPTLVLSKFSPIHELSLPQKPSLLKSLKEETLGCYKIECAIEGNVPTGQCLYYDEDADTAYIESCISGDYCTLNLTSKLFTCQPIPVDWLWPMEKCSLSSQCNPDFSAGCNDGICSPGKVYPNCTYDYECKNGEWCQGGEEQVETGKCVPLLEIGQFGCEADTSCVYNAGCHVSNQNDNYYNLCIAYGSIKPGEPIDVDACIDNKSRLCSSGYCSVAADGFHYCLGELKSIESPPMRCYNSEAFGFCPSQVDKFTGYYQNGTCECGGNAKAYGYCSLHHGDPQFVRYRKQLNKWLNSTEVKNCNTGRRFSLACVQNYWNPEDYAILYYYSLYLDFYVDLIGSEKCFIASAYPQYLEAKKEYDKYNFGSILALSSLLILYS